VATFLVGRGEILRAQHRLGHSDPSTTLRNYAHALPLRWRTISTSCWAQSWRRSPRRCRLRRLRPGPRCLMVPARQRPSSATAGSFFDSINPPIVSRPTSI
jgi:hypothetical protein